MGYLLGVLVGMAFLGFVYLLLRLGVTTTVERRPPVIVSGPPYRPYDEENATYTRGRMEMTTTPIGEIEKCR